MSIFSHDADYQPSSWCPPSREGAKVGKLIRESLKLQMDSISDHLTPPERAQLNMETKLRQAAMVRKFKRLKSK